MRTNDLPRMLEELKSYGGAPLKIMEVCGTHTRAIAKNGLRGCFSEKIELVSGPGCPVCVTEASYIDRLVAFATDPACTVLTFGDMLKVPGRTGSLGRARGRTRLVYSPFQALEMAAQNPGKQFVFAAVGFETTAAVFAALVEELVRENIRNLRLLTSIKRTIPAIEYVCATESIDGFVCPGHVAVVTGRRAFVPLGERYKKPFVIAGFEGEQIIRAAYEIVLQCVRKRPSVENFYGTVVSEHGNPEAQAAIGRCFDVGDACWRGIGRIENSGLYLKEEYAYLDAGSRAIEDDEPTACRCADVILGRIRPTACPLFGKGCTPSDPQGPCMVSAEGACGIWYEEFGDEN